MNTLEATQLINQRDAVIIDIRDQAEYARGHIANAKNFPAKVLDERRAEIDKLLATEKAALARVVALTGKG